MVQVSYFYFTYANEYTFYYYNIICHHILDRLRIFTIFTMVSCILDSIFQIVTKMKTWDWPLDWLYNGKSIMDVWSIIIDATISNKSNDNKWLFVV